MTKKTNRLQNQSPLTQIQNNEGGILTQNISQMYKQNPTGMFVGANLINCTINVNMQK